jgi:hypothetical protein
MPQVTSAKLNSSRRAKALVHSRLRERQAEIEGEILARIHGDGAPTEAADPEYAEGLRGAVPAAIDYCLTGTERGEGRIPPVPAALSIQARVAARNRVSLDTVLRRYFAGYTLLGDFLVEETEAVGLTGAELKRLFRALAATFDRLVAEISEEHGREAKKITAFPRQHHDGGRVERLLNGELVNSHDLAYDFGGYHLAAIARGSGLQESFHSLAATLDRRMLLVERPEEGTVWVWLGGRRALDPKDLMCLLASEVPGRIYLALGEPAEGIAGWRLTHRQAKAALSVALRGPKALVRYAEVAVLAAALKDDLLVSSLQTLYLAPLEQAREGGRTLRQTLRAYFRADQNVSSAAAALGVNRHTVASRLRATEERIGRPLSACAFEVDTALRIEALTAQMSVASSFGG